MMVADARPSDARSRRAAVSLLLGALSLVAIACRSSVGDDGGAAQVVASEAVSSQPTASATEAPGRLVTIVTNAVATFGDVKIGVGNIRDDGARVDGPATAGRSAGLWISVGESEAQNQQLRVRAGQQLAIAGHSFQVQSVGEREIQLAELNDRAERAP